MCHPLPLNSGELGEVVLGGTSCGRVEQLRQRCTDFIAHGTFFPERRRRVVVS